MGFDDYRYVPGGHQICQANGCQLAQAMEALKTAEAVGKVAKVINGEDIALWCGVGGHAFGQSDPGRQRVTVQQWDEDAQEMKPVQASACGEHARPLAIQTRPKQITGPDGSVTDPAEARARGYDPAYVKWLESQQAQPIAVDPAVPSVG